MVWVVHHRYRCVGVVCGVESTYDMGAHGSGHHRVWGVPPISPLMGVGLMGPGPEAPSTLMGSEFKCPTPYHIIDI